MKNAKRIAAIVMATCLSISLFAGCSSKTASASDNTSSSAADANNKKANNNRNDPSAMKAIYTNVLKELVSDKTITQDQADKVLDALTNFTPPNGGNQNGSASPNAAKPNRTPGPNQNKPDGSQQANGSKGNGADGNGAGVGRNRNRLSELVNSNVITQAQADTINQKVQEAMKNAQGNKTN